MKTAMFVYIDRFHPKLDDTLLNTYHTYQTKRFSVKRFIWNWLIYIFGDSIEQRAKENLYRIKKYWDKFDWKYKLFSVRYSASYAYLFSRKTMPKLTSDII